MNIFIVVPFYNEEKHIGVVLKSLEKYKLPIVLVDDGSSDGSGFKINDSGFKNITLLTHEINLGKGAAMKTGAEYAFEHGADAVVFMDGDGQHQSEDLPKFIKAMNSGKFGAVFGARIFNSTAPLIRFLGNKIASFVLVIFFRIYVSDVLCGFKALTKSAFNKVRWESTGYGVETEIVARTGKTHIAFCEIPIKTIYHDKNKGVTILDAVGIMGEMIKWRFTI